MNNGQVCIHTLNVLYLVFTNTEIKKLSYEDQNLLRWAALLHDMCKLTTPKIEGKDHLHPFKSGRNALQCFEHHGYLQLTTVQQQ